jgi:hypothetical protein
VNYYLKYTYFREIGQPRLQEIIFGKENANNTYFNCDMM